MSSWKERHQCKTETEAIKALSSLPKTEYEEICSGYRDDSERIIAKAEEYAAVWGIPFSKERLIKEAERMMRKNVEEDFDFWNRSTC